MMEKTKFDILFVNANRNDVELNALIRQQSKSYNQILLTGETHSGHTYRVCFVSDGPDFADKLRGLRFGQVRVDPMIQLSDRQRNVLASLVRP